MNVCKWCGQEATYFFKITKEYCCSQYPQQCPVFKEKLAEAKRGTKRSQKSIQKQSKSMLGKYSKPKAVKINTDQKCDYGCNKKAKYMFMNGKLCCEKNYRSCPGLINSKLSPTTSSKGTLLKKDHNFLCSYGCGKKAKFKFKNGKYCCSEYATQCKNVLWNLTKKQKNKLRDINKKSIEYWQNKYPFFTKVEKLSQTVGGELLVECKNKKCNKLFTPTYIQLYERIRQLESEEGNGGSYFYCSQRCKDECDLYDLRSDPFKNTELPYTASEIQTYNKFVMERENGLCEYCGEKAEHVHHIRPKKLEPFFALDPDYGVACCEKCHYEKGHVTGSECSTGALASKICS